MVKSSIDMLINAIKRKYFYLRIFTELCKEYRDCVEIRFVSDKEKHRAICETYASQIINLREKCHEIDNKIYLEFSDDKIYMARQYVEEEDTFNIIHKKFISFHNKNISKKLIVQVIEAEIKFHKTKAQLYSMFE